MLLLRTLKSDGFVLKFPSSIKFNKLQLNRGKERKRDGRGVTAPIKSQEGTAFFKTFAGADRRFTSQQPQMGNEKQKEKKKKKSKRETENVIDVGPGRNMNIPFIYVCSCSPNTC